MLTKLKADLSEIGLKLNSLQTLHSENIRVQKNIETEITTLDEQLILLDKVSNLFKHLLDSLLDEKKQEIEQLVTYGLKTVFTDQDLKFHINIEPKYGGISTSFTTEQIGVAEGDVLDSFGGGIVNLESFLLRIITLFQAKLSPFLFLDETFSNLSDDYVENCSLLLKTLCEKLGVTLFLITHNEQMLNHADKVYKAKSIQNKLSLSEALYDV